MVDVSLPTAVQQLRELDGSVRVVVINPTYVPTHVLLNEALQDGKTVYVRLHGKQLSQAQIKEQIEGAITAQVGNNRLPDGVSLLLDESDRSDSAALDTVLPQLVADLTTGRILIVTRIVPPCVLRNEELRVLTRVLPVHQDVLLWDYAQRDPDTSLLEVRSFGSGRVFLDSKVVESWDGLLPRSLFFFLVDRAMTTRNDIFETFWPNLTVREATNVFHVTKRKISEVLGTDLTTYGSGFYRISPKIQLSYDAVQFSEMIQNGAVSNADEAASLFRQAISLYKGDFLTSLNAPWVKKRRDELRQLYAEALTGLARLVEDRDKLEALGLFLRAAVNYPQREDIAVNVTRLYDELGNPHDALATYERLEQELKQSLNVSPAPNIKQLADDIRKRLSS